MNRSTATQDAGRKSVASSVLEDSLSVEDGNVRSGLGSPPVLAQSIKPLSPKATEDARSWAHMVAGAAGGTVSSTLTSPLDVLKTRLQSDFYQTQLTAARQARGIHSHAELSLTRSAALHVRETFQILNSIYQVEGWRALFKGLGPTLVGVVPARAINFYVYGNGKRIISQKFNNGRSDPWVHASAAATAGVTTGTITNPIWVIKTRLQLDKNNAEKSGSAVSRQYRNSWDCIRQTLRAEGIRGFYRGLSASYLGVTESTMQWVFYEQMKAQLAAWETNLAQSQRNTQKAEYLAIWLGKMGFAGTAKFFAALITYPHEVIRTRLRQVPLANGRMKYTGIVQCFSTIWREEGFTALYGGLTPHMLRVVPSAAVMFGMYELILPILGAKA